VEGVIPFRGFRTWYRIVGDGEEPGRLPVLMLHGGPGASSEYLEPLEALAATGRRVIFYDQLGGGKSDRPHDPAAWTVKLFLEQLRTVRQALGLSRIHLFGHSWGGMLALEHGLTGAGGLASLVIANAVASMPVWRSELQRLRQQLPPGCREVLLKHESAGTLGDLEYLGATLVFYKRHVCRLDPWPRCLNRTFAQVASNPEVYQTLYGPNDLLVTGRLHDWSVSERLGELRMPTLVLSGRHDEATPAAVEGLHQGLIDSEWVVFERSSHMPHLEEPGRFLEVVGRFLQRNDASSSEA
jgi:proline-specific peptidase